MKVDLMRKEKRQHLRKVPEKKAFASIGSTFSGICTLKDISMGGVGIGCITDVAPKGLESKVNLFLPKNDIEVRALSCKIVYQKAELLPSPELKGEALFKRFQCGIAFENLDKNQRKMLSGFMEALEFNRK